LGRQLFPELQIVQNERLDHSVTHGRLDASSVLPGVMLLQRCKAREFAPALENRVKAKSCVINYFKLPSTVSITFSAMARGV
jgi:hypothetical protein